MEESGIIIQARLNSTRLPGKMMMPMGSVPLVEFLFKRLSHSKTFSTVLVATSLEDSDLPMVRYLDARGIPYFRGSLNDVQDRFLKACEVHRFHRIARVCGDSPFVSLRQLDFLHEKLTRENLQYLGTDQETCVKGMDSEVLSVESLRDARNNRCSNSDREHVTPLLRTPNYSEKSKVLPFYTNISPKLAQFSLTVDEMGDYELCCQIVRKLEQKGSFSYDFCDQAVLDLLDNEGRNHAQ